MFLKVVRHISEARGAVARPMGLNDPKPRESDSLRSEPSAAAEEREHEGKDMDEEPETASSSGGAG